MTFNAVLGSPHQTALIRVEALDAAIADRIDASVVSALSAGDKQKLITTATLYWDAIRWRGTRVWPEFQRLEWPRILGIEASLEGDMRSRYETRWRGPLRREIVGGQAGSGSSTTASVVGDIAGDTQNYPDDWWNEGSIRVDSSGTDFYEVRTITDFVAATGTVTHEAFTASTEGKSIELVPPLHPQVVSAFVELCCTLARENSGYSDRKRSLSPEILATRIADRMMSRYRLKVYDVV